LKPSPAWRVDPEPDRVEEKIEKGKTRLIRHVDPVTRQDLVKNRVVTRCLFFFTKMMSF
jgi:hypothetical protein